MAGERVYKGSCHCGAVRFEFRSEEIDKGTRCNCSICTRKGAVMSDRWYQASEIDSLIGLDALSVYLWGDKEVRHYFCKTCGIFPFSGVVTGPARYRFNLGCVEGIDPLALPIRVIDGRSF